MVVLLVWQGRGERHNSWSSVRFSALSTVRARISFEVHEEMVVFAYLLSIHRLK